MGVIVPYVPKSITVHLGVPEEWAENVTVSFPDYVKNVASSEVYPTWEPAALRANILAIVSFALNRVYTEFYPSRGYPFQITSTTAHDQKFIWGRTIFEPISKIADELFDAYIRRRAFVEPLSAKFCNGTTSTCAGLSQWGSQKLAESGLGTMEILKRYYGEDIQLVTDAPVRDVTASYPGRPLRLGDVGKEVLTVQTMVNRVGKDYPAIPQIRPVLGSYDEQTRQTIQVFQNIFGLVPDGVVGKATWYKLVYLYVGVNQLSELISEGQTFSGYQFRYPGLLRRDDRGDEVKVLQYMLALLKEFDNALAPVPVDGVFGTGTEEAVRTFQRTQGLAVDGIVGRSTWENLHRHVIGAEQDLERDMKSFPEENDEKERSLGGQNYD